MSEFYHKDIFGAEVDVDLEASGEAATTPVGTKSAFNVFALTDAIGARDKRQAWILYQKALASGLTGEDVFWRGITWEVKNLLLASKTKSAAEAGLNPFVFQKAKSYSRNFKPGELEQISEDLILGYHNARRGIGEIETLVEKVILML